jgi:hypothetical protein
VALSESQEGLAFVHRCQEACGVAGMAAFHGKMAPGACGMLTVAPGGAPHPPCIPGTTS